MQAFRANRQADRSVEWKVQLISNSLCASTFLFTKQEVTWYRMCSVKTWSQVEHDDAKNKK